MQFNPLPGSPPPPISRAGERYPNSAVLGPLPPHIRRLLRRQANRVGPRHPADYEEIAYAEDEARERTAAWIEIPALTQNGRFAITPDTMFLIQHFVQEILAGGAEREPWADALTAYAEASVIAHRAPTSTASFIS
jgi:hypothetical protein